MGTQIKDTRIPVLVPHLAESLVSATVGKWLKQPGDWIEEYDVLCELITDKVTVEMPSPARGRLVDILVQEGETADVGTPICLLEDPEASPKAGDPAGGDAEGKVADGTNEYPEEADRPMRQRYSPAVLTLAQQHRIDLTQVKGTGLGGRITRKDVLRFIEDRKTASPAAGSDAVSTRETTPQAKVEPAEPLVPPVPVEQPVKRDVVRTTGLHLSQNPPIPKVEIERNGQREYYIDVTPIRNTIASRMRQSVTEIPHAWTMIEVDVTNLVALRNKVKDEFYKREGFNLTYLAFVIKAVVNAIKDYPIMNSVWAVDKIIVKRDINISLAVGTEDSVLTPVIKQADQKTIAGLAWDIHELGRKARSGQLKLEDMQGGTFTVNNTGSFGSILSYPIINYPQAALLTFESIVKRPVVIHDMIAVRSMVNLCLSLDHRILDGVICGRFLQRVKENLEGYSLDTQLY